MGGVKYALAGKLQKNEQLSNVGGDKYAFAGKLQKNELPAIPHRLSVQCSGIGVPLAGHLSTTSSEIGGRAIHINNHKHFGTYKYLISVKSLNYC